MKRLLFFLLILLTLNSYSQDTTTVPLTGGAPKLVKLLDSTRLDVLWQKGYTVNWLTGVSLSKTSSTSTHCSAFAAAFADKLGIYFLRPPQHSQTLLANAQCDWLATDTAAQLGWKKVSTQLEAQNLADSGVLVMVGYKSPISSQSGHMAVLRPFIKSLSLLQLEGPQEAQSGDTNAFSIPVKLGFSNHPLAFPNGVIYYQHSVNWDSLFKNIGGTVTTPLGAVVPSVKLHLSGTSLDDTISNQGVYGLSELTGGNYTVRANKSNDINKRNGVSVMDALLIQSHILGKTLLNSPYKLIAADVDNSGSINVSDVLYLKRFILGIDSSFKGNRLWAFVDSSYRFATPTNPFPFRDSVSFSGLMNNVSTASFIGIKLGDVNYDWNASILGANPTPSRPIELFYDDINTHNAQTVTIPVRVKDFNSIAGMQFTLNYNQTRLSLNSINAKALQAEYNLSQAANGKVSFLWMNNDATATTLADSTVLFELVFDKKEPLNDEDIRLSSDITPMEAWDANYNNLSITKGNGKLTDIAADASTQENWELSPNPSNGNITIRWENIQDKTIQLQLYNVDGILLSQQTVKAGNTAVSVNLKSAVHLAPGVYYLKALGLTNNTVKKILIR